MKDVVHHVAYSFLRCQYLNKAYNENPETEAKVIQIASIESYKWWKTLVVDIDILVGGGALLFFVLTLLPPSKPKKEEN